MNPIEHLAHLTTRVGIAVAFQALGKLAHALDHARHGLRARGGFDSVELFERSGLIGIEIR